MLIALNSPLNQDQTSPERSDRLEIATLLRERHLPGRNCVANGDTIVLEPPQTQLLSHMAFTENETEVILRQLEEEFWVYHRPPFNLRDKVREGQRIDGQSIELFLNRPAFRRPDEWIEEPIAKIRYFRSRDAWAIYWQRADLKWHCYDPCPETETLSAALAKIHEDEHACFFG